MQFSQPFLEIPLVTYHSTLSQPTHIIAPQSQITVTYRFAEPSERAAAVLRLARGVKVHLDDDIGETDQGG